MLASVHCGLIIADIDSGNVVGWFRFAHTINELDDVAVLPDMRSAEAIGSYIDDIQREIAIERTRGSIPATGGAGPVVAQKIRWPHFRKL